MLDEVVGGDARGGRRGRQERGSCARRLGLLAAALSIALVSPSARAKGDAERGVDLFVHGPTAALAGDRLALDFRAYGFVDATSPRPLGNASITTMWDPESLGPGVATAPADVSSVTDALGQSHVEIAVPDGDERKLTLLVAVRSGEHVRSRKITIGRLPRTTIDLRAPDTHVVPGSHTPAWITVLDGRSGRALAGATVDVALLEGTAQRESVRVVTDATGLARASFEIPKEATGTPALSLRARLATMDAAEVGRIETQVRLDLREEVPAMPRFLARWQEPQLKPGEVAHAELRVLDAASEPLANHPILYWVGPKGTTPPASDEDWKRSGVAGKTDGLGRFALQAQAPRVVTTLGSELTVVARTEVEGESLTQRRSVPVGLPVATAELSLEGGALVPGIAQRAYLHVTDGEKGVTGELTVDGDGLHTRVTTDAFGYAELLWNVPEDIGGARSVGPCAGGVAASVIVRQPKTLPALERHPEPFELCVSVQREETSILRVSSLVARVGDTVRATAVPSKRAARGAGSFVLSTSEGSGRSVWSPLPGADGRASADIDLAGATAGIHEITLAVPQDRKNADTTATRIVVLPPVLPKVVAKVAPGPVAPNGQAEVDIVLDDGHGKPVTGSVTALVIDKEGGGNVAGLERLDTRVGLCEAAGMRDRSRCDAFLEGDATADLLRRATLTTTRARPITPVHDPSAHSVTSLKATFSAVLHSLEGAVFQAQTPESLRDVRRKEKGAWVFNPELMTLVTAAMEEPPTTPGGEPFGLTDLIAVDPQVTFDNVARRVTRLRLFTVLAAIRGFRMGEQIDGDEPMLADPNGIIRRLVRDGKLTQEQLLDPWGGTLQFVRTTTAAIPFLTVSRGFRLVSPGPDGRVGTPDDVNDPFERVVRKGSPYAEAMGEDEIVDARLDMRVGDATVTAWQEMFARLTGSVLGHGESTGTGQGFGSGHGGLGGSHMAKSPSVRFGRSIATDSAHWTEPMRTDALGRLRMRVPLGGYETTWQIAFLARTDGGQSAVSTVDVPAFLPLSAHLEIGRRLTVGDEVSARILVRNRTTANRAVVLALEATNGLELAQGQARSLTVDVAPSSVRGVFARFVAKAEGVAKANVVMRGGADTDRSQIEIPIQAAGELRTITTSWTSAKAAESRMTLRTNLPPGSAPRDRAQLLVESGFDETLLAALAASEPEPGLSPDALADTIEIAARVSKLAEARKNPSLAAHATRMASLAKAYLAEHPAEDTTPRLRLSRVRAGYFEPASATPTKSTSGKPKSEGPDPCPKDGSTSELEQIPAASFLEAEPPPLSAGPILCFTTLANKLDPKTPLELARAVHALVDRPHRAPLALTFARELARKAQAEGARLPSVDGPRHERVVILSALARTAHLWSTLPDRGRELTNWLVTLRDARGGYGSSEATRDAVRAIVALEQTRETSPSTVTVMDGKTKRTFLLQPNTASRLELGPMTRSVDVEVKGGPIFARLVRPTLRTFAAPPESGPAPVTVTADWPAEAKVGSTSILHVTYKGSAGRAVTVRTQVPLPPGSELAGPVKDVVLRQGVLYLRATVTNTETISIPLRFMLPGRTTVREAVTFTSSEEQPPVLSPARSLVVTP